MENKRGRPLSTDEADEAVRIRRQQTAARTRAYRERRLAIFHPQTTAQRVQAESISKIPFSRREANETIPALGLRVDGDIPADEEDAILQQEAIPVDEHDELYQGGSPLRSRSATPVSPAVSHFNLDRSSPSLPDSSPHVYRSFQLPSTPGSDPEVSVDENSIPDSSTDRSSDKATFDGFASEHEEDEGDEDRDEEGDDEEGYDEDEPPFCPVEYASRKLLEQLQDGFHGCTEEEHREKLQHHMQEAGNNHHGLAEANIDKDFPRVLLKPTDDLAKAKGQIPMPSARQWASLYCGTPLEQGEEPPRPRNICLHMEGTRQVGCRVSMDSDSLVGFASSPAVAKQGLAFQPAAHMQHNIVHDVHVKMGVPGDSGGVGPAQEAPEQHEMLRDIPHTLLGRIEGLADMKMHVLFPFLPVAGDKFIALTQKQQSRWLNEIFNPILHKHYSSDYMQHLPSSQDHALDNSRAHHVERRQVKTPSYQTQQGLVYHLQPHALDQVWSAVLEKIESTPGLQDFREPQLFFSVKNLKLRFKSRPEQDTSLEVMYSVRDFFQSVLDMDYIYEDHLYLDIGKEICSSPSRVLSQPKEGVDDEAQVFMWKRCCLQSYMQWMYDGEPPAMSGEGQKYYELNMLHEACNMTSVTPKKSKLREGGLIYSQFYSSVKEAIDAAKCYPFDNEGIEELTLDERVYRSVRRVVGTRGKDRKVLENAYMGSKRRVRDALHASQHKSFGIREEHRITWRLFLQLIADLEREATARSLEIRLDDCPSYVWPVKTVTYLSFLWRSVNKFAMGYEVVKMRARNGLVSWEQTKMMAMFLRCLQHVVTGSQLRRESALWWSRRERSHAQPPEQRVWYGLGLCNTLERYGYGWLEPRFDWDRLVFDPTVTDHVLFGNGLLKKEYLRARTDVTAVMDANRSMDLALGWLSTYGAHERIRRRLLKWMVHICLESFRQDVMRTMKGDIDISYRDEALLGQILFCHDRLSEITGSAPHLVSGNRGDFKQPHDLGQYLFDHDDKWKGHRGRWDGRPYRELVRRATVGLRELQEASKNIERFWQYLWELLYRHHWMLPYASRDGLTQTTKEQKRMWFSIKLRPGMAKEGMATAKAVDWVWCRKDWQEGEPLELPPYVGWRKEDWLGWFVEEKEALRRRKQLLEAVGRASEETANNS